MQHNGYLIAYQTNDHRMNTMEIEERHLEMICRRGWPVVLYPIPSIRTPILSPLILSSNTQKSSAPSLLFLSVIWGCSL
jgi:hypothetical protein